jgi:hypothetical protein
MQKYTGVVIDAKGAPMAGVTVQVNVAGGSAASIFSDNAATAKANPFINDANGSFEFYAANGRYDIVLSKTGVTFVAADTADIALYDSGPNPASPAILHAAGGDNGTPAGTGETTLKSFTNPWSTLATNGDYIRFRATLRTAGNANTKTIRVKYGATTLMTLGPAAFNADVLLIEGTIVRTGAATQRLIASVQTVGTVIGDRNTVAAANATETLSGDVLLSITGQNGTAAANDIVCDGLLIEYLRTP